MKLARLYAMYFCCNRWHSGQWSRGYRLLCRANSRLRALGIDDPYRWPMSRWPAEFLSEFRREYRRVFKHRHSL